MTQARSKLISLETTPYYHCVSRCVRRAFLCGEDPLNKQNYEHRRQWFVDRVNELSNVFAIDVCAYAIMNNHSHFVLHINKDKANTWSIDEIIHRWHRLFKGCCLSQRYLTEKNMDKASIDQLTLITEEWQQRLYSISWFMKLLNEYIARLANEEDGCTGHFWEGRFKSQALLDESALMACMAYVDLNPIRATIADTPEESDYTSIQQRIQTALNSDSKQPSQPDNLYPFAGNPRETMPEGLPFRLEDYIELVDWSGRQIHPDKRGYIDSTTPDILQRLAISPENWQYLTSTFETSFKRMAGHPDNAKQLSESLGQQWMQGIKQCRQLFSLE